MKTIKPIGKLLLGVLLPLACYAETDFERGISAFQNQQYQQALEAFKAAEQQGDTSPALSYNAGVTYLKLGRYAEAVSSFERLALNPDWRDVANFNLALAEEKRGNQSRARGLYHRLQEEAASEKLRSLAGSRLQTLSTVQAPEQEAERNRLTAIFNLSGGHDTNAFELHNDIQASSSTAADNFREFFGWGSYDLSGGTQPTWRLQGFAYQRRYSEFDGLDLGAYSLGLLRQQQHELWRSELGVSAVSTSLDGDKLSDQNKLMLRFQRPFRQSSLILSYLPSRHVGGGGFSQLDGTQHIAEMRWRIPANDLVFDLAYRWEANDREDLANEEEFFSYSPTRQGLSLGVDWLGDRWLWSAVAELRGSEYDGTNRLTDSDGVFKERVREADRLRLQLKTQWQLNPAIRLGAELEHTDNRENFQLYSYDKTEFKLSFELML